MDREERCAAKAQMVAQMQTGQSWQEAATRAGVQTSRTAAYRLLQRVRIEGAIALRDQRHGHPVKLRGPVREWLAEFCRAAPESTGRTAQAALFERFGLEVSVSQINRLRAALGVRRPARGRNQPNGPPSEPTWHEGAGSLLLLAAAQETGVIAALEQALPTGEQVAPRLAHTTPVTRRQSLLTLLFLGAVGLRRTWDLRGYTGDALALLTGRRRASGFWHTERFLSQVARAGGDEALTDALAKWTATLWSVKPQEPGQPPRAMYVDGHKKPVYTDHLIQRGLVGRTGKVLGCRALLLLHDAQGHPLFATTQRGDLHLTKGAPAFLERFEQATGSTKVARLIIDREGMAAEFLAALVAQERTVVTILRSNQYQGLSSFTEVGAFVPLCQDRDGVVTREVACARFVLPLPDHPGQTLPLAVALIRDLRRPVPVVRKPTEGSASERWDADLDGPSWIWWKTGWVATPTPAVPTEPKLIPIVTTAASLDPVELVQVYTHRWPAQENSLRDFLVSLGLETNHGYAQRQVENSEVAKSRAVLERKLAKVQRQAQAARERRKRAEARFRQVEQQLKAKRVEATRALTERLQVWEQQGVGPYTLRERREAGQRGVEAELAKYQERKRQAGDTIRAAFATCERACQQERDLLRQLEDLAASERTMYELDVRPVQLKLAK